MSSQRFRGVEVQVGGSQFLSEIGLPGAPLVVVDPYDPMDIGGEIQVWFLERCDARTSELADEVAELENNVLSRARRKRIRLDGARTHVIRGEQHDRKRCELRMRFKLLDECTALVGLLGQNDRFEAETLKEPRRGLLHRFVVTVHDENLSAVHRVTLSLG